MTAQPHPAPPTAPGRELGPGRFQLPEEPVARPAVWRSIGAALVLLVIVVGIPVGLIALAGVPELPTSLPAREQLTAAVGAREVLSVLVWVAWLAWLQFSVCVLVELRSAVRGIGLPARVPLSGPSQRLARTLVASVLLLVTTVGPASAMVQPAMSSVVPSGPSVVMTVDTPDGGTALAEAAPAVAVAAPTAASPTTGAVTYSLGAMQLDPTEGAALEGRPVYVVQPPDGRHHDNLWDIAERTLGDGRRYQEIFELNKGRVQADGRQLDLARLIQPNWLLVMPEDAVGVERVAAVAAPATEVAPTAGSAIAQPAGADSVEAAGAAHEGSAGGSVGASARSTVGEAETSEAAARPVSESFPGLVGAGLLAAGLLAGIEALRRRRRTPEPSAAAAEVEVALRVGAEPERAARLDAALRGLVAAREVARLPLPPVYAARVDDAAVELFLSPPSVDAPEPWEVHDDGRRWRHPADGHDPFTRRRGHAAYPGLVSIGRDERGGDVLVDLEAAQGPVCVVGPQDKAREVVTALAAELATNAWSGPVTVHGSELPEALVALGSRYRPTTDPLAVVGAWSSSVQRLGVDGPVPSGPPDVLTGRSIGTGGRWAGEYLVVGAPVDPPLAAALVWSARAPWSAVVVGDLPGARWRWEVDAEGFLAIPVLGLRVRANRLRAADLAAVAELLQPAARELDGPDGQVDPELRERPDVPLPARPVLPADLEAAPVSVRVLGVPHVSAPGPIEPERVALATELVVHLALHPDGVHPSVLAADLWPHGVTREVREATVARARAWLGTDSDGAPRLRERQDGRLVLASGVVVDWGVLLTLLRRARSSPDVAQEVDDLSAALELARGAVLAERPRGRYAWLVRARLERASRDLVVDAAHRLAVLLTAQPDPVGAAGAARAGLRVAPLEEVCWRDLLRAAASTGGPAAVHAVAAELEVALHRAGVDGMTPPTAALLEELAPRAGGAARSTGA